jgi:hypothetical protein
VQQKPTTPHPPSSTLFLTVTGSLKPSTRRFLEFNSFCILALFILISTPCVRPSCFNMFAQTVPQINKKNHHKKEI